ncbi:MAG: hypothetical protein A3D92_24950 [Bacteroidetes bacterium RIFCSPHIGHO2_02_FULL_44_7]|nr:MAG: hypothetical protein A3D92_24950 [Bacteroidetes bacterium RIFCSPHIGHO2_02_FULL_44_7]
MIKRIGIIFLFMLLIQGTSFADVIHLKSGGSTEGIIETETDDSVTVVVKVGKLTYPKALIESISKASGEENAKLKKKWEEQKQQRESEQEEQRKFAAEQEAKEAVKEKPPAEKPPEKKPQEEKPLKLIDTISFYDRFTYRYAVRLPPNYNSKTKYPVLFSFDPGGNGEDAAKRFAYAADNLGWIVVGSLDTRNGPWPPIRRAQEAMLKDIPKRFSVNEKRFYAAGLSGGARMSFYIARNHSDQFKGVIACGAGLDDKKEGIIRNVAAYLCVGKNDSNLGEIQELYNKLDMAHAKVYKNEFDGGHEWPSPEIISQALDWIAKQ